MNHEEVYGNIYKDKKDDWLEYVEQNVLCTAFTYAGYCRAMEMITDFLMKESLRAAGLGWM